MYTAVGQGQTIPGDKILMSTETSCHFGHLIQVLKNPFEVRGQNFDFNRKALSLYPFVASFKEMSLTSDFIQFFHDLIHVYSPWVGGIQPLGDIVLTSTETSCHFGHLLLVSNHRPQ